ncbi:hypothetical protein BU24DRAFT_457826 [Aaosphaeria arxii CBS 175.79]|uniref:Uncharacterized protein n=1 Tax=Aaosphaeria arxii CBS 175.79 TaxID=1450172 RepID=A0A6A5Y9K0_9PLEO|nr:uncharacterized protein BU24DRAFT_457826 [Aaosphaeria arxii CBS 175.79]KAF2021903.1 hypothetical protein BU24DRAFT_457826 [Aaosphaeria arxii CBS 175.79]
MQHSTTTYAAIVALLHLTSSVTAAPSAPISSTKAVAAPEIRTIRLGHELIEGEPKMLGAYSWTAGEACTTNSFSGHNWFDDGPCRAYFSPSGTGNQYYMEGCDSPNGTQIIDIFDKQVGECKEEEHEDDCGGGNKYIGKYLCTIDMAATEAPGK